MIRVLDHDTANKIAAGEVVERPASVVKELIENSLDAGSSEISVEILNGGTSFIRVRDNGSGIKKEELPLALERHATSKISSAKDLLAIGTLGFRGEALPSIAAVSRFKLSSCVDGEIGSMVEVEGGEFIEQTPKALAKGTIIEVTDLFYNVPARRKFLRTENTESGRILRYLEAMAIARPDVAFTFISNGKKLIETQGTGSMLLAIKSVYGTNLAEDLLPVDHSLGTYEISGFVGKPDIARGRRDLQIFIINQRLVECKTAQVALEKAFGDVIPKGRYPIAFLEYKIPTDDLDVNVHPAKLLVRLASESQVFSLTYKAVRTAVDTRLLEPASFMEPYGTKQMHHRAPDNMSSPEQGTIEWVSNREKEEMPFTRESTPREPLVREYSNENFSAGEAAIIREEPYQYNNLYPKILGQVNKTYIMAEWEDCLILYDQHSAHERILYEKYLIAKENMPQTELLFPLPLKLTPEEFATLDRIKPELELLGFELTEFGPATLAITHVPIDVRGTEAEDIIKELLLEKPGPQFREKAAAVLACKGAVKAGDLLDEKEMLTLIKELNSCLSPALCPHGRPTMLKLDWLELEKRFGRNR